MAKKAQARRPPVPRGPSGVVGIGASAGGLQAIKEFFKAMTVDSGLAFVVVQHLEPAHESQMAEILAKYTGMRVAQAEEGMAVQANCVYTIPSGKYLSIREGRLRLTEPLERHGMRMAIDYFFRSLAEDQSEKAICLVLSGSGSDGTHGLRAVRSSGGMCMAQDPRTAQFGIMPQSAIDTGLVDYVLPADRMPQALLAYARHPYLGPESPRESSDADSADDLASILRLLQSRTHSDYHCYKTGTVMRRIERRMGLRQIAATGDYLKLLQKEPRELLQLAKDMQIGVTSFFRDCEAFDELHRLALTPLVAGKDLDSPVRAWVPGCATGEEAYSVAMLLLEELASAGRDNPVQVFASDVDETALETARNGVYPPSIAADVSPERLDRFFSRKNDHYQAGKHLREAVVFARQNLISDPPFSKMDLITCRNVLIYLQPEAQQKVFSVFGFALNLGGTLFLGKSETLMDPRGLFETLSKSKRIYRLAALNRQATDLPAFSLTGRDAGVMAEHRPAPASAVDLALLNQQMLLRHFGAAIVLVEPKGKILHFYGQTEKYLGHPEGLASLNVFDMASGTLALRLRRAMRQAMSDNQPVAVREVSVSRKGSTLANVTVAPVPGRAADQPVLAIILEEAPAAAPPDPAARPAIEDESTISQLEAEVKALRGELEATNQEHGTTDEELRAANEEVMSMNEELQSSNEELETSKEELQSINEELNTVNNQLNEKVGELTEANNDMANLFGATDVATVFVDMRLRIRRFTPRATELFNLIAADIGRPLGHITQNFDGRAISVEAEAVMKDLAAVEREVQTPDGRWHTMRILPYRTLDNRIDGAVVTFADVTRLKRLETYAESIVGTIQEPLLVLDSDLRVISANPSFYRTFKVVPAAAVGRLLYKMEDGEWDVPDLRRLLVDTLSAESQLTDFQVDRDFHGLGHRIMRLNARRIELEEGPPLVLLAMEDVTEREEARKQLESLAAELDHRVKERTAELAQIVIELEHIYNAVPVGLALLDTDLRFVRVNDRMAAMNGRPASEHIGRTFRQVLPEIADVMEAEARRVLDTGQAVLNVEGRGSIVTPDKRRPYWLSSYIPVKAADGTVVGVCKMVLDVTEHKQADEELRALNETLTQRAGQLRALATELTLAEQRERKRLSQVLHDGIQQLLAGAKLRVGFIRRTARPDQDLTESLTELDTLVTESIRLSRSLAYELSPSVLSDSGLVAAMRWLGNEMKRVHGLTVRVTALREIPADTQGVAVLFFQAVRELLFNIVKHAKVKSATIRVRPLTGNQVQIDVIDKGAGFDLAPSDRTPGAPTGLGLFGIQERIAHMGGRIEIRSNPGKGTRVTLVGEIRPPG